MCDNGNDANDQWMLTQVRPTPRASPGPYSQKLRSMNNTVRSLSYPKCVVEVLRRHEEPLSVDALLGEISKIREVGSGGRSAVYRALKALYQAVPVDADRYGWLTNLLNGSYFRHPLTSQEMDHGYLLLDELEHAAFFPEFFQNYSPIDRRLSVQLFGGPVVHASAYVENRTWSLRLGNEFSRWIEQLGGFGGDNLIIYIDDAAQGLYTLRLQPYEARDIQQIEQRNLRLALSAESIVAGERDAQVPMRTAEIAARLIARGVYSASVPPDELHYVLHHYSGLSYLEDEGYMLDSVRSRRHSQRSIGRAGERQFSGDEPEALDRVDSNVNSAMRFLGFSNEHSSGQSIHDRLDQFAMDAEREFQVRGEPNAGDDNDDDLDDEFCNAFVRYMERVANSNAVVVPLSHHEFHLIAAELEYMLALEDEFEKLLADQIERKHMLAERLLLDPNALSNDDLDIPDFPDLDDPPFWDN